MSERSSRLSTSIIRILDYVSVATLLLSFTILITGGFRESVPWGRISMTSWVRPFIIALLAMAIRHWLQPRPTIVSRVAAAIRRLRQAEGVREAIPITLSTRAFVLVAGILAVALLGFRSEAGPPWRVHENEFLNLPARWDTGWYLGIAAEGYRWQPSRAEVQQNIAFFPAYPMLMRYVALFLGRELLWTGVLISWVSFFWALVYMYRFTRARFDDESGRAAITLIACSSCAWLAPAITSNVTRCGRRARGVCSPGCRGPTGACCRSCSRSLPCVPYGRSTPRGSGRSGRRSRAAWPLPRFPVSGC
jgi:hypothetical protein